MGINIEKVRKQRSEKELLEFGILNLDKPRGPTSFDISDLVREMLGLRKTSHFGTLDPKVTGVLPIALNRACKLTGFFLGEDKEYVGIMRVHREISLEEVEKKIKEKFLGKIIQLPPVKSQVKRQEREREIKSFEILEQDGQNFLFRAEVQGGTYIRKLIHDLGEALGIGAHMLELRRIRAGIFREENSITLYELEKAIKEDKLKDLIIPGEIVSKVYPVVEIKEKFAEKILHGQPIYKENLTKEYEFKEKDKISVFTKDEFMGVFEVFNKDDIFAKPRFVLQPIKEK